MLVKTFNIILFSILSMLFFVMLQKPYEIDKINYKLDFKSLEAYDIKAYEIDTQLKTIAYAKQYYKIANQDNLINLEVKSIDKTLKANKVIKENNEIIFKDNVVFKDEALELKSEFIKYLINERTLSSNTKSIANYNGSIVNSNNFKYNLNTKDLSLGEVSVCINN